MATSQELLQQLIAEASTLTTVFKNYRTELDASVNYAISTIQTTANTKMALALDNIAAIQATRTYYVDAVNGLDTNTGLTTLTPFKTIAKAASFAAAFCITYINLRINQKHIVNTTISLKGHAYFTRYRMTEDPAYNTLNVNTTIMSGSAADIATFEAGTAIIQFEEPPSWHYGAHNYKTVFPTVADATAYMAIKDTHPSGSSSKSTMIFFNFNGALSASATSLSFNTITLYGPRYDLMEDEYYRVLKPWPCEMIRKGDSFTKTFVNFYSCPIKTHRCRILGQAQGCGSVCIDSYGSNIYMDAKLSPINSKPINNAYKHIEILSNLRVDYIGDTFFYYAETEAGVAATVSILTFPGTIGTSITDTDHPARNVVSRYSPTAKIVYDVNAKIATRIFFPDNT